MPSSGLGAWIAGQGGIGPSGGPDAGTSAATAGGSASSSIAPPVPVVAAPLVAAAVRPGLPAPDLLAPGSPVAFATSSESGSVEVHPDIPVLQRECDLARGRFSAASVEIEHLRESLRAVEVARGATEDEVRMARDAQARAFGVFYF